VTVDLLTTGVDIPDLEFLVFLRPVKSRILFEQMLGRGTRKGEKIHKSHFTVFDCFDGTLLRYFRQATAITAEPLDKPTRTIVEVIDDIWNNRDRDYNVRCLVKRLHRIDKQMSARAREQFAAFIPDGDVTKYARGLTVALRQDFVAAMKLLRGPSFQDLLENYERARDSFLRAIETEDVVTSEWLMRDGAGKEMKPEDYLAAFAPTLGKRRTPDCHLWREKRYIKVTLRHFADYFQRLAPRQLAVKNQRRGGFVGVNIYVNNFDVFGKLFGSPTFEGAVPDFAHCWGC